MADVPEPRPDILAENPQTQDMTDAAANAMFWVVLNDLVTVVDAMSVKERRNVHIEIKASAAQNSKPLTAHNMRELGKLVRDWK